MGSVLSVSRAVEEVGAAATTSSVIEEVEEGSDWNIVSIEAPASPKLEFTDGVPNGYTWIHDDELNPPFPPM